MANGRTKIATQSTSASWLNNAIKSIGLSAKNVLQKEYAPNLYEAVSSGAKTSKSIITTLRQNAAANNRVQNQLANNKYVKYAQTAYKNALYDLRTGNFNNEGRTNKEFENSFGFDELEDAFGDDFSFGDDGADVDVNIIGSPVSQDNSAMFALTDQVRKGTEATLKTSQANMNAMIAMNSASMMQIQTLSTQVIGELNSINQNISAMIEFNNTSMNKFIQSSLAFYERMGTRFDSEDSYGKTEKLTADQVMNNRKGGINFSTYKDYIKQNFKSVTSKGTLGMLKGVLDSDEMIQMAISNPLGFATEGIIKYMMPKLVTNTIQSAEAAFSSFLPMLLHRVGEWGEEQANGMFGKVKQVIGKVFGLKMERIEKFDVAATIEKDAVPFDGITRHAIVEVITKELREQTSYLRAIAAHQGIDVDKARKSADIFSYKTGTYVKQEDITAKILEDIRNRTVNGVMDGSFGKALRGAATTSADAVTQKKLNAMIDELAVLLEKNKAATVLRDTDAFTSQDSRFNKIMGQLSGASDLKKLLSEVLQDMVKNNPRSANDLARSVLSASSDRNKMIKYIQDNPLEYSLYAANLGGKDLDELILRRMRSTDTRPALKNGETIQSLLGNYQTSHPKDSNKWYSTLAGNFNDWLSKTTNDGGEAFFKKLIGDVKNGVQGVISGIMSGDSDKALKSIFESITTHIKGVWKSVDENFLGPIKDSLFGIKDAQGFRREGLLSGMVNAVKDTGFMIVHSITGKGYKSSSGKVINDKKEDEETVVGNIKKAVMTLANGIQDKSKEIYGKVKYRNLTKDEDENEEGITEDEKRARNYRNRLREAYRKDTKDQMFYDENGKIRDAFKQGGTHAIFKQEQGKESQSAIGFLVNSFKEGFIGWQEAFFGKELTDKEKENIVETMQTEVNKRLPSTITGSIAGTGIGMMTGGSLLGTITLGPIGGAAIGAAVGFASKSEEFQDWLFGKKDAKTKERMGGFISKNVQDYVKKNKGALAVGGTLGAIKGAMGFGLLGSLPGIGTGIGILNSVVGGPVLGALMGIAGTIFTKSHMFKEFLFGDKETGQKGILASFKSVINYIRGKDSDDELSTGGKLFGMSTIGAGGGALTAAMIGKLGILGASLTPGGVIGGALVGLGLAIRASKDNFKSWLFGEKDKNGKKTREGVLGQFRNMMIVNVVHPLRNVTLDILDDAKMKFQGVLDTVRWAVEPFGTALADVGKGLKNLVTGWFNKVGDSFKENIITPLGNLIFKPITNAIGAVTKALWTFASNIAMTPFRLVKNLLIIVSNPIVEGIKTAGKKIGDLIQNEIIDPMKLQIKSFTSKLFGGLKTILNWTIKKPFDAIAAFATYATDKMRGVGKDDKKFKSANGIKGSVWEQMRERFKQDKVKRYNNKKASRERKIRTKNEQAIAEATGNQKIEDTEENRRIAEAAGFKINRDIEAVTTQEEADRAKIVGTVEEINTHEDRQTELMEELVNRVGNISDNLERQNQQENSNQGGGRRKQGQQNNTQSGTNNPEGEQSSEDSYIDDMQSNITEARRKKDEESVVWADGRDPSKIEDISSNSLKGSEKILHDIYAAGGAGKYIKNGVSKFFSGAKEGFKNSWLGTKVSGLFGKFRGKGFARGTTETPYGEDYDVGEAGRELMISTVGENGRERMSGGGRSIIPFIHGATALPVFIQGAQPGVFSSILTGLKSFFIDRPLRVLRGAKNAIKGHLATKQAVDSYVDSSDVMGDSQLMLEAQTLGGSDNPDEFGGGEGGGASLAGIAASVEASHSADGDSEASQEAEEDDKRNVLQRGLSFLKQKFAAKKGLSAEELKEQEAKRKERKDIAIIGKNTGEQVKSQNKFTDLWSSIFSKKGLITAGLILVAPLIINLISGIGQSIQHIVGSIGNTIGWAVQSLVRLFTNGGLGDGKNIGDTIGETVNRFADLNPFGEKDYYNDGAGTFGILNEDGRIDRLSAPMAKELTKAGAKATGTVVGATTKGVTYFRAGKELLKTGGISKATQKTLKSFSGKKLSKIGSETMINGGKKTVAKNVKSLFGFGSKTAAKEAAEGATKAAAKEAVEGTVEGGTKLATTALKEGNKGLLSKVIEYVKDFFSKVLSKAEGFAAKHSSKGISKGIFKNLGEKVTKWLSKNFGKVGAKISEFLATTAGLAATVVGWLVKEGAWVLLGAIDGLTGARKLFHIDDEPDWKMTAIATLLGAFGGTTIGCIMDIINGAICAATGLDIYCEIATLIYNCVSSQDDQLKLRESRENFENEYYAWSEDQMRTQYQTMKKYGLLKDPNMSEDDYVAAVKAGEEDAAYMGIQEYNVDKHKSMYDHVINGVTTGATKVGFFSGFDKDAVKYDTQGNKYTNNHDGTWTVNDNENEKISEDTVKRMDEEGKITKTEEQYQGFLQRLGDGLGKGIFNIGKGIGDAWNATFHNKKGSAFVLPDGSYYDLDGNHYDAKHHLIKAKERTLDELLKMKFIMQDGSYYDDEGNHYDSQGNLIAEKEKTLQELQKENADRMANLEKDFEIQKSGFDQVISDFGNNWKSGFDSICNWVGDAFTKVGNAIKEAIDGWNNFWKDRGADIYNWFNGGKKDENGPERGGSGSGLKYYSQNDPRWKDLAYGTDGATMSDTGCAPAAMSMVASSMSNRNVEPNEFAALAEYTGMRDETGTNSNFINIASSLYGMNANEVLSPNEERLKNSISTGPTILLGTNGTGNNPYTSAGHYVVADGYNNGYVNIKDPRGKEYNRRYRLKDIVKNTNTAWSFGGNEMPRRFKSKLVRGGHGTMSQKRQKWLKIIQDVKKLYSNYGYYSQVGRVPITYNGKTLNCRLDCSGYVSACIAFAGIIRDDQQPMVIYNTAHENGHSNTWGMSEIGFTHFIFDGDLSKLSPGDVMSNEDHTQIFAGIIDGQPMVYSVGSDWQCAQPGATSWSGTGYTDFWSIDGVKSDLVYKGGIKGGVKSTSSGARGTVGDDTTSPVDDSTESTSSSTGGTTFEKITSWISQFTSKAINGLITGNWDTNYVFSDDDIEITPESNINPDYVVPEGDNYTVYEHSNREKHIMGFFLKNGIKPKAAAGIIGSIKGESSLNPQNVGDDVNSDKTSLYVGDDSSGNPIYKRNRSPWAGNGGITDEEFTKQVDNGEISRKEFTSAKWGTYNDDGAYGYGLMQWCAPPENKEKLYDYAKAKGTSIGDLDMQLAHMMNEMKAYADPAFGVEKGTFIDKLNASDSAASAARLFTVNMERPGGTSFPSREADAESYYTTYKNWNPETDASYPTSSDVLEAEEKGIITHGDFTTPLLVPSTEKTKHGETLWTVDDTKPKSVAKSGTSSSIKPITSNQALKDAELAKKFGNGGNGIGKNISTTIKQIRPYTRNVSKRGGKGEVSIYSPSITATFKPSITAKKYITSSSSADVTTAINYIIGYLEAITNNTAGANDKLTALRNLSNGNKIYVGTTNNNINGSPVKTTAVVKNSNNGQANEITRGMQIAQKIAKG